MGIRGILKFYIGVNAMDSFLTSLILKEFLWIPQVILFISGNLYWRREREIKLSIFSKKGEHLIKEKAKKTKIVFTFFLALMWLILAELFHYSVHFIVWILFCINQSFWIFAKIKYFHYIQRNLGIFETPPYRTINRKENILLGKINSPALFSHNFSLSLHDLRKHMFVCGLTGMGKSNFVQFFLTKFCEKYPKIPFLIMEFKGEYQSLQRFIPDIQYLHPGESFSLNIFDPLNSDPDIHAERLFDILRSCDYVQEINEFSPQMEKVLVDILKNISRDPQKRDFASFEREIEQYRVQYKNKIPMLEQTIISITNRLRRLLSGPLKRIFSQTGNISISQIFTNRTCLDLSSIIRLGGEKRDALFFLNMMFKYLWDRNLSKGGSNQICHMCVLEDAQYMIPQSLIKQSRLSTYIEDVALLQRGSGEILVSLATRTAVSKDVLANAGVFISFQSHYDTSEIQELLSLKKDQIKTLGALQEGECLIRVASIPHPFSLKVPLLKPKPKPLFKRIPPQTNNFLKFGPDIRNPIQRTFLCYFHNIRGPQLYPFCSHILTEFESQRILGNMEIGEGLCELTFDQNHYLMEVFEVSSKWGRGGIELFMVGLKLDPEDNDANLLNQTKSAISEFVANAQRNPEFYKICYFDRIIEESFLPFTNEINQEYLQVINTITDLDMRLHPHNDLKLKSLGKPSPHVQNLNPEQFEALKELNEVIELLLRKEK